MEILSIVLGALSLIVLIIAVVFARAYVLATRKTDKLVSEIKNLDKRWDRFAEEIEQLLAVVFILANSKMKEIFTEHEKVCKGWDVLAEEWEQLLATTIVQSNKRIGDWELLFTKTLEDVEETYDIFHKLVSQHNILIDDPDIMRVKQVFGVLLSILGEYIEDGKELLKEKERKEKEE